MLFIGSKVKIVDNTAAKLGKCIRIIKPKSMYSNRNFKLGFIILISLLKVKVDKKLKKGDMHLALIVRINCKVKRVYGNIRFFENHVILLNKKYLPIGNKIKGPISQELRNQKYIRILSMSTFIF
jgi:large subunit ribosomal protein L14